MGHGGYLGRGKGMSQMRKKNALGGNQTSGTNNPIRSSLVGAAEGQGISGFSQSGVGGGAARMIREGGAARMGAGGPGGPARMIRKGGAGGPGAGGPGAGGPGAALPATLEGSQGLTDYEQAGRNENFLVGMDQSLPDGPFSRAQDAWTGSWSLGEDSGIFNQDGGMTERSEFNAGKREGLGIVGGILDSEQQSYQDARGKEKSESRNRYNVLRYHPWEVAESDIKGDGHINESKAREAGHRGRRENAEQPTPFNQGLYKDTQYGITFTDKAQRTGFTGNFEEWKSKQRFKYMSAVTRDMRRKRDNKRLGLDDDYGSKRSRAAQIAARKEMPEVNNAPNG